MRHRCRFDQVGKIQIGRHFEFGNDSGLFDPQQGTSSPAWRFAPKAEACAPSISRTVWFIRAPGDNGNQAPEQSVGFGFDSEARVWMSRRSAAY